MRKLAFLCSVVYVVSFATSCSAAFSCPCGVFPAGFFDSTEARMKEEVKLFADLKEFLGLTYTTGTPLNNTCTSTSTSCDFSEQGDAPPGMVFQCLTFNGYYGSPNNTAYAYDCVAVDHRLAYVCHNETKQDTQNAFCFSGPPQTTTPRNDAPGTNKRLHLLNLGTLFILFSILAHTIN